MREIIFRGKRVDNGEWVYGYVSGPTAHFNCWLIQVKKDSQIYSVIPETVGQFTGLKDKNGLEIYEGDIINSCFGNNLEVCFKEVVFENYYLTNGWGFKDEEEISVGNKDDVIVGNIHDEKEGGR